MDFVAAAVLASAGTFAGAIGASAVVAGVVAGLVSRTARSDVAHATGSAALPASGDGSTVTRAQVAPSAGKATGGGASATATAEPVSAVAESELRERRSE